MKNNNYLFLLIVTIWPFILNGQSMLMQKTITDSQDGRSVEIRAVEHQPMINPDKLLIRSPKTPEINWQFNEPAGIGSKIVVSGESGYTFNSWWLNNERVSLYENSATPLWENTVLAEWEFPIDMTPDGEFLNLAYDSVVQVFSSSTQTLVWEKITNATLIGTKLSVDGSMVYVVENMPDGQDKCTVSAYEVGNDDPVWQTTFPGTGTAFAASGDRSMLAFCQYTGYNKLWVLEAAEGNVIFDTYYKNQNPPAFSYDGSLLLNGDYSGYVFLYEYEGDKGTYIEKWNYKVNGGGTSDWIVGMDISADGSTVAVGTLTFITGGYNGQVYVFNAYSPDPLWVYENAMDQISSVSISDDGSLIAAAGYGPLDHSKPDFFLFRKESSDPLFEITTPGSFNSVDISGDGKLCSVTGKAVHAREFGNGGLLYNVNSDPGGGTLAGTANVDNVKIEVQGLDNYYAFSNDDGNYQVKYIPAGVYSVKATKVGYYPVTEENVEITEGEVTELEFVLEETGNPPTNLMATHGSDYSVLLSWEYPDPGAVEGFNIYRKTIPEAQFPEEPLQTIGNNLLEFEDTEVMPLVNYYYAVTAVLGQDIESPYSNISEGWMAHGFVINTISAYQGSTPVIDGTIDEGEWDDAFVMDASDFLGTYDNMPNPVGSVMMYYKVNAEMTELYVACINQNDTELEDHDEVALYIDDNNDGIYPPSTDNSEGNYWAAYYAAGNELKYRPIYNTGGVGTVVYLDDPQLEVSDATGVIVYEFMIPIGEEDWMINPDENNQSGFFSFVLDDPSNFDGYWPCQNLQIFEPSGYGTITFDAADEMPVPPTGTSIWWDAIAPPVTIILEWEQPEINDFDHFNVYMNTGGGFEFLTETIGTQLFYLTDSEQYTEFYVTTVDMAGNESGPSQIMIFDITVGISETGVNPELTVYPNPASDFITMDFVANFTDYANVAVYDANGHEACSLFEGILKTGKHTFTWNAGNQPAGIFILKIQTGTTTISKKIMVVR